MNCNPQALLQAAACYRCIPKPVMRASMISMLCEWANNLTPPPVECGTPSDVILISGAGNAGMNGTYIHDLANPNIWQSVDNAQARIRIFAGTAILEFGLAAFERYTTPIALFPCTWSLGIDGTDPVPTGMYLAAPPIAWTPTTEPATWTDMNGVHVGDLANFQANAHTATISDITFGATGFLTNIVGLGNLPSLATLDVSGNALVALDMTNCTALTTLNCYNNSLTALNVTGCTALIGLSCYNNSLTTLNVTSCTALADLNCIYNSLTTLNVTGCTALNYLYCAYNVLTLLDVSTLTALLELSCYNNSLATLNVTGCTALTTLYCYNNSLPALDVSTCTALTTLNCSYNSLTALDVSTCTALTYLYCSNNSLTALDVSTCTALTGLYCFNNSLTSLDVSTCTALMTLYCNNNSMNSANVDTVLCDADVNGALNGTLDITNNSTPGAGGIACATSLSGKGWTVSYDP